MNYNFVVLPSLLPSLKRLVSLVILISFRRPLPSLPGGGLLLRHSSPSHLMSYYVLLSFPAIPEVEMHASLFFLSLQSTRKRRGSCSKLLLSPFSKKTRYVLPPPHGQCSSTTFLFPYQVTNAMNPLFFYADRRPLFFERPPFSFLRSISSGLLSPVSLLVDLSSFLPPVT